MRQMLFVSSLGLGLACAAAQGAVVELTITGSWVAADFDVSSTGPDFPVGDPEGDDDLVFGVAPSDGSTTFTLRVDTASSTALFPAGYLSNGTNALAHDMIGYTDVELVGVHTFGSATWTNADILTGLVQVDGLTASLWTDTDLTTGNPTRVRFRMSGEGDDLTADLFVGADTTETAISDNFLLWEYFGGEEIRSQSYEATVPAPGGAILLVGAGALACRSRRRA